MNGPKNSSRPVELACLTLLEQHPLLRCQYPAYERLHVDGSMSTPSSSLIFFASLSLGVILLFSFCIGVFLEDSLEDFSGGAGDVFRGFP